MSKLGFLLVVFQIANSDVWAKTCNSSPCLSYTSNRSKIESLVTILDPGFLNGVWVPTAIICSNGKDILADLKAKNIKVRADINQGRVDINYSNRECSETIRKTFELRPTLGYPDFEGSNIDTRHSDTVMQGPSSCSKEQFRKYPQVFPNNAAYTYSEETGVFTLVDHNRGTSQPEGCGNTEVVIIMMKRQSL